MQSEEASNACNTMNELGSPVDAMDITMSKEKQQSSSYPLPTQSPPTNADTDNPPKPYPEDPNPNHKQPKKKGRAARKKRRFQESKSRYNGITYTPRESTGRPGTPHRFFSTSYNVHVNDRNGSRIEDIDSNGKVAKDDKDSNDVEKQVEEDRHESNEVDDGTSTFTSTSQQIIHRHKNGLIMVTAGTVLKSHILTTNNTNDDDDAQDTRITNIKYQVQISNSQSVGSKRKKARKMKGGGGFGGGNDGFVKPHDTLATVTLSDGAVLDLKCCVAGTLLELNDRLIAVPVTVPGSVGKDIDRGGENSRDVKMEDKETVEEKMQKFRAPSYSLLEKDPLLDGFLAVIMPAGFPEK
jgi:hypothetical protein